MALLSAVINAGNLRGDALSIFVSDRNLFIRMCAKLFCSNCIEKSKFLVPEKVLKFEDKTKDLQQNEGTEDSASQKQYLCTNGKKQDGCLNEVVVKCMEIVKNKTEKNCGVRLEKFFINECPIITFELPCSQDTKAVHVTSTVADMRLSRYQPLYMRIWSPFCL